MGHSLDIGPLRSLVAVADFGGFQRAAEPPPPQPGRGQPARAPARGRRRSTARRAARSRLAVHRRRRAAARAGTPDPGATTSAAQLRCGHRRRCRSAPPSMRRRACCPRCQRPWSSRSDDRFRYRIDRGARLREGLEAGQVDLALLLNATDLDLRRAGGRARPDVVRPPGWQPPAAPRPVPVVAFDSPCGCVGRRCAPWRNTASCRRRSGGHAARRGPGRRGRRAGRGPDGDDGGDATGAGGLRLAAGGRAAHALRLPACGRRGRGGGARGRGGSSPGPCSLTCGRRRPRWP